MGPFHSGRRRSGRWWNAASKAGFPDRTAIRKPGRAPRLLAQVEVEGLHPLLPALGEPVAVGRVGDEEAVVEIAQGEGPGGVGLGDGDLPLETGGAHVGPGGLHRLGAPVEPTDGEGRLSLAGAGLGADAIERGPGLGAERGPALDAEAPVRAGRPVHGEEPRLDQEGARAAHRVQQRLVAGVADGAEDGRGERLLERCDGGAHPVAPPVQRAPATSSDSDRRDPGEVRDHADVGAPGVHVRPRRRGARGAGPRARP